LAYKNRKRRILFLCSSCPERRWYPSPSRDKQRRSPRVGIYKPQVHYTYRYTKDYNLAVSDLVAFVFDWKRICGKFLRVKNKAHKDALL